MENVHESTTCAFMYFLRLLPPLTPPNPPFHYNGKGSILLYRCDVAVSAGMLFSSIDAM